MAKIIELKIWPKYFSAIASGEKKFELRLGNINCRVGDVLLLREWDPKTRQYTGKAIKKEISYIFKTKNQKFWAEKEIEKHGFIVMSLDDLT